MIFAAVVKLLKELICLSLQLHICLPYPLHQPKAILVENPQQRARALKEEQLQTYRIILRKRILMG